MTNDIILVSPYSQSKKRQLILIHSQVLLLSLFDSEILQRYKKARDSVEAGDDSYDLNKIFNKNL